MDGIGYGIGLEGMEDLTSGEVFTEDEGEARGLGYAGWHPTVGTAGAGRRKEGNNGQTRGYLRTQEK